MADFLPFIVIGVTTGAVYGLAGVGLVLTYKTSGIFNFAYGAIGCSGGLLTDGHGRVRHVDGTPIPNLYAAGDAAASCFGPAYGGPGGPLGHGLTVGYLAGRAAAGAP